MNSLLTTSNLDISIGDVNVCRQLDWSVNPDEVWGILGLNGMGKTTLLKTLAGLRSPMTGKIMVKDQPVATYSRKKLAQIIGYLFQELPHDFPQTLLEYCSNALHPQLDRWQNLDKNHVRTIRQALQAVELEQMQHRLLSTLSGGEQRRAEIACLLIQNPAIWLLDEPLNHLDIHHQITMMQQLIQAAHKKSGAVIAVLHDANLALRFCTHVLLLQGDGKTQVGITEKLLTRENLSALYQHPVSAIHGQGKTAFLPD